MAFLLNNTNNGFKSGLVPLSEKLDDKNNNTWRYQTPPETIVASAQASEDSGNTMPGSAGAAVSTPPPSGTPTPNKAYREWR
ncbi:hypothetical protein PIB30_041339 [Stylosanthes scabra]|uniref:Uncharacterized protein n=1 Tax=Stylosanthes scabra TaxID=79078 RepID=A0ABU6WF16_9FABA|nr:hypothetical protein [Stylosanthes scabra]